MSWSIQPTSLTRRPPLRSNLSSVCYTTSALHCKRIKLASRASAASQPASAASDSRWPIAEAERLLEEQMAFLEAERSLSLTIAQQCTVRSKRLMARLDNLKAYRSRASPPRQRWSTSAPDTLSRGPSCPDGPRPSSTVAYGSGPRTKTADESAPSTGNGVGNPSRSAPIQEHHAGGGGGPDRRRQGSDGGCTDGNAQPEAALEEEDQEEAQARRLASQALRRNISRGENNLALAEKLQQYIGLLREELTRVRKGDVALAAKVLEGHAARNTAKATAAAATARELSPAAAGGSLAQLRPTAGSSSSSSCISNTSKDSNMAQSGPTAAAAAKPAPSAASMAENRRVVADSQVAADPSAFCHADVRVRTRREGLSRDGGGGHNADFGGLSLLKATSSATATVPSSSSNSSSNSNQDGANATTRVGSASTASSSKIATSSSESSDSGGSRSKGYDAGSGSIGGSGGGPDAASGLGRIFSRNRLLALPGDTEVSEIAKAAVAGREPTAPRHEGATAVTILDGLQRKSSTGGGDGGCSSGADPRSISSNSVTTGSVNGSTTVPAVADVPDLRAPDPWLGYPKPAAAPEAGLGGIAGRGGGGGSGQVLHGLEHGGGSSAGGQESYSSSSSFETLAPPELGLSLEAARSLARDSEDARNALMGLLSPDCALPGPLQLLASGPAEKTILPADGDGDGGDGGGGGQQVDLPRHVGRAAMADSGVEDSGVAAEAAAAKSPQKLRLQTEGLYALAGDQVPSGMVRVHAPSAAVAAARASAAAAAAAAAPKPQQPGGGGGGDAAEYETSALIMHLGFMVSELRRRGYVGCDEQMDLATAQLQRALAAARVEAAASAAAVAAAAAAVKGRRER